MALIPVQRHMSPPPVPPLPPRGGPRGGGWQLTAPIHWGVDSCAEGLTMGRLIQCPSRRRFGWDFLFDSFVASCVLMETAAFPHDCEFCHIVSPLAGVRGRTRTHIAQPRPAGSHLGDPMKRMRRHRFVRNTANDGGGRSYRCFGLLCFLFWKRRSVRR